MMVLCRRRGLYLFLVLLALTPMGYGESTPDPTASLEFILPPVSAGFSGNYRVSGNSTEVVFKKEPPYSGDAVSRHALLIGENPSDYIGVAFDRGANMLYVDRNRNLDLTDDGPGISGKFEGHFSGVNIELKHGDIPVQYSLNIIFFGNFLQSSIESGWMSEIEIAGKPCRMGLCDNMDGVFGIRDTFIFDHEQHRETRLAYGEVDELPLPQWVYFGGQCYRIESVLREQDGETVAVVTLSPITDNLMPLALEGQYVSRVMLADGNNGYGMLDWPIDGMRIPKGQYLISRVDLLDSFYAYPRKQSIYLEDASPSLKVGGPPTQEVSVVRSGPYLSLDYALIGVDKMKYHPDSTHLNYAHFAVYTGGRQVGGDRFRYG